MKTVSLFSSYGMGDLGLRAAGAEIVLMAEKLQVRCEFLKRNFPDTEIVSGNLEDCWETVAARVEKLLDGEPLYLLVATPPCQGMSTNGAGKLAAAIRNGKRPKLDLRNRLIIPALEIIKRLRPRWVVFENVVQMENTVIEHNGGLRRILDIIDQTLGMAGYLGGAAKVDFGRQGIPQDRQRLITVYGLGETRPIGELLPPETGDPATLRQTIGHFEELDSHGKRQAVTDPLHRVKRMNKYHYWWTSCITEPGGTAYDNKCADCGWNREPKKGKQMDPACQAYCMRCSALLPRPSIVDNESRGVSGGSVDRRRIISGFRTAYKRMEWDRPAPTVTMNMMTPSSDNKLHPEQNRTLSPAEAAAIQTVDLYPYNWGVASDRELCDALGEAVPPLFFERLLRHLLSLNDPSDPCTDPSAAF